MNLDIKSTIQIIDYFPELVDFDPAMNDLGGESDV